MSVLLLFCLFYLPYETPSASDVSRSICASEGGGGGTRHICAVPSSDVVSTCLPSGLNATERTLPLCVHAGPMGKPVVTSQRRAIPSSEAVAIICRFGL